MDYFNVVVSDMLSRNLALRDSASYLFDEIEDINNRHVTVDFKGVETITRSFAHEYITRKSNTSKDVTEINVPIDVEKMFEAASYTPKKKKRFPGLAEARIISL